MEHRPWSRFFAGRLADFDYDYRPLISDAVARSRKTKNVEVIWASTREVFNVIEADAIGCQIILAPADILKSCRCSERKRCPSFWSTPLFREDAMAAALRLEVPPSRAAE